MFKISSVTRVACAVIVVLAGSGRADAQGRDVTFFVGRAFPTYDERLTLRPPTPRCRAWTSPSTDRRYSRRTAGRCSAVRSRSSGASSASKDGSTPPRWAAHRPVLGTISAARHRRSTGSRPASRGGWAVRRQSHRAPVGERENPHAGSGGPRRVRRPQLSSDVTVTGSVPIRVEIPGIPAPRFRSNAHARAVPGQSDDRWGVNGGAGLRIGGRVAVMGEVRVFYFPEYELRFERRGRTGDPRPVARRSGTGSVRSRFSSMRRRA